MRRFWTLMTCGLLAGGVVWLAWPTQQDDPAAVAAARAAREDARAAGFPTESRDVAVVIEEEEERRAAVIVQAAEFCDPVRWPSGVHWMRPMAPRMAVCGWREPGPWEDLAILLHPLEARLDTAVLCLMSPGRLRFGPADQPGEVSPQHLASLPILARALTIRMGLDLRDGRTGQAWINLLAVQRLAAAYRPQPDPMAILARAKLVHLAFAAAWEALQTNSWTDRELAALAAVWEPVQFGEAASETAAVAAVRLLGLTERGRSELRHLPVDWRLASESLSHLATHPLDIWTSVRGAWTHARERRRWAREESYRDEVNILNFHRRLQQEWVLGLQQSNWTAMRDHVDAGQEVGSFWALHPVSPAVGVHQLYFNRLREGLSDEGSSSLAAAVAGMEIRRRVLLSAVAIERFRRDRGRLPESLDEVAGLLPDFATGGPLQFRRPSAESFVLYSPGTDGEDDGGALEPAHWHSDLSRGRDVVWPRAALASELQAAGLRGASSAQGNLPSRSSAPALRMELGD